MYSKLGAVFSSTMMPQTGQLVIFASLINIALFLDGQFSVVPRTRQFYVMPRTGLNNPHYSERFWVS